MLLKRIAMWTLLAMAAMAVWRAADGDAGNVVHAIMSFLSAGADILVQAWHAVFK